MDVLDFTALENAARNITDQSAAGSRGSAKYDKAVQVLLSLSQASSGFVISKKAFKEAIVKTDFVEFDKDEKGKPLPSVIGNIKYGFTNFRIGYKYQKKNKSGKVVKTTLLNGSMISALKRTDKFYIADGGDILFLIPFKEFKAYKKALLKTEKPTLIKLVSRLEANYKLVYRPSLASEVVKATS